MAQLIMSMSGQSRTEVIHEIVQHALRSAATASNPNVAIDVLGDALLELERLVALRSVLTHSSPACLDVQRGFRALFRAPSGVRVKVSEPPGLGH
ncbi:hypothetical protein WN982_25555 [Paraburkholderia sp. IMGN_8]|uniref:hypothetical protein n=1 Tax=Paraburkholderia sp. IMGN_8 TaxID=3136564 RepID=UPI003100E3D3